MSSINWDGWSDWSDLESFDLSQVPWKSGVYVVASTKPVSRVVGVDEEGILDVGESADLRTRLNSFIKCVRTHGVEGHMAGWRFAFFRLERHFPLSTLRLRWITTPTKADAYQLEGELLLDYLSCHCELPPLNYKFNWQPFDRDGWDLFDRRIGYEPT